MRELHLVRFSVTRRRLAPNYRIPAWSKSVAVEDLSPILHWSNKSRNMWSTWIIEALRWTAPCAVLSLIKFLAKNGPTAGLASSRSDTPKKETSCKSRATSPELKDYMRWPWKDKMSATRLEVLASVKQRRANTEVTKSHYWTGETSTTALSPSLTYINSGPTGLFESF